MGDDIRFENGHVVTDFTRRAKTDQSLKGIKKLYKESPQETIDRIRRFTEDRDWDQFHSPENLAKSIVIEAAELLECFQWSDSDFDLQHVKEELVNVIVYTQDLLDKLGLDADEIVNMKMEQNERKYPIEKAKGNSAKYDQL